MPNHYRQVDDLDIILRDALRSDDDAPANPGRVVLLLRERAAARGTPARLPWSLAAPGWTSAHTLAWYWYLGPLICL